MEREKQYASLPGALLPWFRENARDLPWRRDREPYHVWLSEIMLQQTRVEAVRGYYLRFLEALPTVAALAETDEGALLKLWEGLGYYSRARNLQKAARVIVSEHGGRFPEDFDAIRALPGVGPYTAGAIASICFEQPRAAVDGNVLRVLSRITECGEPVDLPEVRADFTARLERVYPAGSCGAFTQSLMELGATVCTPRSPRCESCPCAAFCLARERGTAAALPARLPKKDKRVEERTVFLLRCGDRLGLRGMDSSRPYYIQFTMKVSPEEFFAILAEEAEVPFDPLELVYPGEVPVFEKYDEYLPEELVKKGFAYGILGIDEMKERIRQWKALL